MTAFLAEARRLGVPVPPIIETLNRFPGAENGADDEGLCITGCTICREFRNSVRAALEVERAQQQARLIDWLQSSLDEEPPFDYELSVDFGTPVRSDTVGGVWEFEHIDVTAFLQAVSTERLVAELNDRFNA